MSDSIPTISAFDWVPDFVCGSRFTMADVYVGSQVDWGLCFGSMPATGSLTAYQARIRQRPAYAATMGAIPG